MTVEIPAPESLVYGEFSSIFKEGGKWTRGEYKLPDGTAWIYNEPDAVLRIQRDHLRVRADPLRRSHDTIQILDDAKHLYQSTKRFPTPEEGGISFDIEMDAKVTGAKNNDLYNGFVVFGLTDLEGGFGLAFLTNGIEYATLYARHTPLNVTSQNPSYPRFFEIHDEHSLPPLEEGRHHYTITYSREKSRVEWLVDGEHANYQDNIPDPINTFAVEIGLMTAVELGPNGSRSLQGQGITGEWSELKITSPSKLTD